VQVIETRKRVLRAEHPDTLTSMANLASTFWNQGRWKEAEELEVQVIETSSRVLGAEHPDTLTSMANLAHIFKHQDHDDRAIELMTCCMGLCTKVLGPSHHLTQSVLMTLTAWWSARCVTGEQGGQGNSRMPGAWVD
jgi:Tetratricopeptide repeat